MNVSKAKRKVGRPRASIYEEHGDPRQVIVKCAAELFSSKGYSATTMQNISVSAGLKTSSIYYYFKNKDDIRDSIIDVALRGTIENIDTLSSSNRFSVRLYQTVLYQIRFLTAGHINYRFFLRETPSFYTDDSSIQHYSMWVKAVLRLVQGAIDDGDFCDLDPRFALNLLQSCMLCAQELHHFGQPMDAEEIVKFAIKGLSKTFELFEEICCEASRTIGEQQAS